ncbi:MAG: DUF4114 domain-containing protein, partial [Cyanobacteria bacterium P01_A01_bin.84]
NETDFWEILNKNLVQTLLTESIPTDFGVEYNLDEVVDSLTVDIQVQPGSADIDTLRGSLVVGTPEELQQELIDLRDQTGSLSVSAGVSREAAFDNIVGFYEILDTTGGIDTSGDGVVDINPGDTGYKQAALENRVTGLDLLKTDNQQTTVFDGTFDGGTILAPFIIVDGTLDKALNNSAEVYFSFLGANSDGVEHIRLIDDNTFGFEDLPNGGDNDFNDMTVGVKFSVV